MSYDVDLIYQVAKLYYKDRFLQDTIARKLNISRYKVNRILKKAKENDIVRIIIVKPKGSDKD